MSARVKAWAESVASYERACRSLMELEAGAYDGLIIDPPWHFKTRSAKGEGKSAQAHYNVMKKEHIRALPIFRLASVDAVIMTWATAPLLDVGIECMKAWGFKFVSAGAWHKKSSTGKKTAFGTGFWLRSAAEFWLIGTTGRPKPGSRKVRNLIEAAVREHSRKPDDQYAVMEQLVPSTRRIELFARQARPGWDAWGDQVGLFKAPEAG